MSKPCTCCVCNIKFRNRYKSKYCPIHKAEGMAARGGAGKPRLRRSSTTANCRHCGIEFIFYNSQKRKYCSYECHLKSGGAQRAGEAAAMAKRKYGNKKDANHNEIFDAILEITEAKDLSDCGCGIPDGLAWVKERWELFDVKNPNTSYGKRGLNPCQKKWAINWKGGCVYLIYTADEAREFAKGNFERIKRFPDSI